MSEMDREMTEDRNSRSQDEHPVYSQTESKKEEKEGHVSQPAIVIRQKEALIGEPQYEVRSLDRNDADMGRPIFVLAEPDLESEICVGDVAVLFGEPNNLRIIDVDNGFPRSGETATILGVHINQDFPYELQLEGDGYLNRNMDAIKWERLEKNLKEGDRVKVMGGVIHNLAPKEKHSRFVKNPREDLERSDLHGAVPNHALDLILAEVDRYFNPEPYLPQPARFGNKTAFLFYGPPGVGKTFSVIVACSVLKRAYNNGNDEKIVFLGAEGSAIDGALVGSGPKALREIRSLAKRAMEDGKLPITFINEAGSLLRSREVQNMQLDGGSSLASHEQFLAMLSGPDEIPGIIIVDLNMEKLLDEATRQRFTYIIAFPHIDRETFVDQMFQTSFEKDKHNRIFNEDWKEIRSALLSALNTKIGTVMVGSEIVPVTAGHLTSGRMYDEVMKESISLANLHIHKAKNNHSYPMFDRVTSSLLYFTLTKRAWSLFKCWGNTEARERLVPEIARPEKAHSIDKPTASHSIHDVEMPHEYDCRGIMDEIPGDMIHELN
jgi:hypothetical protein